MTTLVRCPQCSGALPVDAPCGLCPKCLMRAGLSADPGAADAGDAAATQMGAVRFAPPALEELSARFPELEILERVGQGGMGAVYRARQPRLDRLVALKILSPELARDPAFAERFTREAQALARLSHPHIVTVYDFGARGELLYLIMEFVDGLNLRQLARAEKMAAREVVALVPQICEALQFAHDEGIVHRDIKPENILIDQKGRVKIADFGLAKMAKRAVGDPTLTGTGQIMGTLHYMAPEQIRQPLDVDHRADIYALGVVLYELLTGELPLGRFAPPSRKSDADPRLDEVVMRALAQEPGERYQRAVDVRTDVDVITNTPGTKPDAHRPTVVMTGDEAALERIVLSHLPHNRERALAAVAQARTGATLGEVVDTVDAIGLKHGIAQPPIRISGHRWARILGGTAALMLIFFLISRPIDVSPVLGWTFYFVAMGVPQAWSAWKHRGTERGWTAAFYGFSLLTFLFGALATLVRPTMDWLQRALAVAPGRHDALAIQCLLLVATLWSTRSVFKYGMKIGMDTRLAWGPGLGTELAPATPARLRTSRLLAVILTLLAIASHFALFVFLAE